MTDAEFIIGIVSLVKIIICDLFFFLNLTLEYFIQVKNKDIVISNYISDGGYHPPLRQTPDGLEIISKNVDDASGIAKIEFSRLLTPPKRKPIRHGQMKCT